MTEHQRLLTVKEVVELTRLSRTTIHMLREKGEFVTPIRLSPRRIAFRRSEVEAWIESHRDQRA